MTVSAVGISSRSSGGSTLAIYSGIWTPRHSEGRPRGSRVPGIGRTLGRNGPVIRDMPASRPGDRIVLRAEMNPPV
jgi:hypothetical protein